MINEMTKSSRDRADLWAAVILLASLAGRLAFVLTGQLDLVQDEAQYWDWSRHLQLSYYSKGPLVAYIIAAGRVFFGDTQLGVRIFPVLAGTLTLGIAYLGLSRLFERPWAGVWTVVMGATMPLLLGLSMLMTTDSPLALCWTASFFALYAAGREDIGGRGARWPYVVLASALALGILAKYMMVAFAGIAIVYALLLPNRPKGMLTKTLAAVTVGLVLGAAPIVAWNIQNDWVGFKHVAHLATLDHGRDAGWLSKLSLKRVPEFLGAQAGLAAPWWFVFMLWGGIKAVRASLGRSVEGWLKDQALLAALAFWPMLLTFLAWTLHSRVYANWPAMAYIGGVVLGGMAFADFASRKPLKSWIVWPALGVLVTLVIHLVTALPVPDNMNPAARLMGNADLGRFLDELRVREFDDPRRVLYLGESYDVTSVLAFYVSGQPTAYLAPTSRRMAQYDLWPVPGPESKGMDALYVMNRERPGIQDEVAAMFDSAERVVYRSKHKGRSGRVFTVFVCRNYNGRWPKVFETTY